MGLHVERKYGQSTTLEFPDGMKIRIGCQPPEYGGDVRFIIEAKQEVLIYRTEEPRNVDDRLREAMG